MTEEGGESKPTEGSFVIGDVTHSITVEADGPFNISGTRYVKEDDLLANKSANEARIAELTNNHNDAISKLSGDGSSTRTLLLQAQADAERFKGLADSNATAASDLEKANADIAALTESRQTQADLALLYRKKNLSFSYNVPEDKLDGKDMSQLGFFEEALQAVNISAGGAGPTGPKGGIGSYAVGGGGGGNATPVSAMERALKTLENADKSNNTR